MDEWETRWLLTEYPEEEECVACDALILSGYENPVSGEILCPDCYKQEREEQLTGAEEWER